MSPRHSRLPILALSTAAILSAPFTIATEDLSGSSQGTTEQTSELGLEHLVTSYFDINIGAAVGSEVIGRVHLSANRFAIESSIPESYRFELHDNDHFEISKYTDKYGRVYGVIQTSSVDATATAGLQSMTVELYDDDSLLARQALQVEVVSQTSWDNFYQDMLHYCLDEQSRMWGRQEYSAETIAFLIQRLEENDGKLLYGMTGSGSSWSENPALPLNFYDFETEAELENYGVNVAGRSTLADELEQSAITIATMARAMHKLPEYNTGENRERLKNALYRAIEQYLRYFPQESFSDFAGIEYNDTTHQWRFGDPLTGAMIYLYHDIEQDKKLGSSQAISLYEDLLHFLDKVNFSLPFQELAFDYNRYYSPEFLDQSVGAWADANRHHRMRSWAAGVAFMKDYNRPITYHEYWYPGYQQWGEQNTTILPGWSPKGSFADLKHWIDTNGIVPYEFGQCGILPDGTMSHHTGTRQDMAMFAYGYEWLMDVPVEFAAMLKDTAFKADDKVFNHSSEILLYSYPQLIYRDGIDFQSIGRSYDSPSAGSFGSSVLARDLEKFIEAGSENELDHADELAALRATMNDNTHRLSGNFAWWTNDFMIHRSEEPDSPQYYMSVKMQSQRTRGAESFNDPAGFHNGSGVLQVKVDGDEYDGIRYDWDQHILPGITEEMRTDATPKQSADNAFNPNPFAGTASDLDYGLAAFQYESENEYTSAAANKSYYFQQDAVFALGSQVRRTRANEGAHIVTVVDQDVLKSDITYYAGDGGDIQVLSKGSIRSLGPRSDQSLPFEQQVMWFHQGKKGYVVFPDPGGLLRIKLVTNDNIIDSNTSKEGSSDGRLPIFSLMVNHREDPDGTGAASRYHYAILPDIIASEMPSAVANMLAEKEFINSDTVQGVYHHTAENELAQVTFYQAGTASFAEGLSLSVDKPSLVQLRKVNNQWKVTLSDPLHHDDPSVPVANKTFEHESLDEPNVIQLKVNKTLTNGLYQYQTQGMDKSDKAGQQVLVYHEGSDSVLRYQLPDAWDAEDYGNRQNLYLGMPASITVAEGTSTLSDYDNDGFLDYEDAFPLDATEWLDTDGDWIGNNADLDDDGDGIDDAVELAYNLAPLNPNDADEDPDKDGLTNKEEINMGENPYAWNQHQLIKNGGFETISFVDTGEVNYRVTVPNWNTSNPFGKIWPSSGKDGVPANENWVLEVDVRNETTADSFTQSISTLPGETYTLSFDLHFSTTGNREDSSDMEVWFGEQRVALFEPDPTPEAMDGIWRTMSYSVVASSEVTELRFNEIAEQSNYAGASIDNVSLLLVQPAGTSQAPVAADDTCTCNEDEVFSASVIENDSDPDGHPLSAILVDAPDHGTLTLSSDGSFTYIPNANYFGADHFTYKVNDGAIDSKVATVTLSIIDVPEPDSDGDGILDDVELANGLDPSDPNDAALDFDRDGLSNAEEIALGKDPNAWDQHELVLNGDFEIIDFEDTGEKNYKHPIPHWTASNNNNGKTWHAVHKDGVAANGNWVIELDVRDYETADVFTQSVSTIPGKIYTLSFDYHFTTSGSREDSSDFEVWFDGELLERFEPAPDSSEMDRIWRTASYLVAATQTESTIQFNEIAEQSNFAGATIDNVSLKMEANSIPVATDDSFSTGEDEELQGNVLGNDLDADGLGLIATLLDEVNHGTLTLGADGNFTYSPNPGFHGIDSFTYQASDGEAPSNTATVSLEVIEWVDTDLDGIHNDQDLDDDGDGIDDDLELSYGFDPLDPSDANEDADEDGITNVEEIAIGQDPTTWTAYELVLNGDFETISFVDTGENNYKVVIPDWEASNTYGKIWPASSKDGVVVNDSWVLELDVRDKETPDAFIQTVPTVVGKSYTLSFDYHFTTSGSREDSSDFEVWFGDVLLERFEPEPNSTEMDQIWRTKTYTVTATSSATVIQFNEMLGQSNYGGATIDNVSLMMEAPTE